MVRIFDNIIMDFEREEFDIAEFEGLLLITCGLSQKSSVTASSIDDDGFVYCIQRGFCSHSGSLLLPQEFKVRWASKHENIYPYLEFITALLISGKTPDEIAEMVVFG